MLGEAEDRECVDVGRQQRASEALDVQRVEDARDLHARQLRTALALDRILKVLDRRSDDGVGTREEDVHLQKVGAAEECGRGDAQCLWRRRCEGLRAEGRAAIVERLEAELACRLEQVELGCAEQLDAEVADGGGGVARLRLAICVI